MKTKANVEPHYTVFLKRFLREGDKLPERALRELSRLDLVKYGAGTYQLTDRGAERCRRLGYLPIAVGGEQ